MSIPNFNQTPFLPNQLNIPTSNLSDLAIVLDKMYIDIASRMNDRTIGIFSTNRPFIIGDAWYVTSVQQKRVAQRQIYQITGAGVYPHNINTAQVGMFTRIYGSGYDGTNWYPLPYVDVTAADNQISIVVTPTDIEVTAGSGSPPVITSGFVILEWISPV